MCTSTEVYVLPCVGKHRGVVDRVAMESKRLSNNVIWSMILPMDAMRTVLSHLVGNAILRTL